MSEITTQGGEPPDAELVIVQLGEAIIAALPREPLAALSLYENGIKAATSPLVVARIQNRFRDTMKVVAAGRDVGSANVLSKLAYLFVSAREDDRDRLIASVVDQLVSLGVVAQEPTATDQQRTLKRIGDELPSLVLEGTQHQQFCCKLAIGLGTRRAISLPDPVVAYVARPLIQALKIVLRVGAPTTRDGAVEGLGALLKLIDDPDLVFLESEIPRDERKEGDPRINTAYIDRLRRRRLIVLPVAGHRESRSRFKKAISKPVDGILDRVRRKSHALDLTRKMEEALYSRADLLRSLPAISRQNPGGHLPWNPVDVLCDAANVRQMREDDPAAVLIAFAYYQESLFRTIDPMVRRDKDAATFDRVVAEAVQSIPHTMVGTPAVCNFRIRATIAILRTAVSLARKLGIDSQTGRALQPLFDSLKTPTQWANLGIAEGCYRALPDLLPLPAFNKLSKPALDVLFSHLEQQHHLNDLVATHRHLVANSCFRRILIKLTDEVHERHLSEASDAASQYEERVERNIRALLRHPDTETVLQGFQSPGLSDAASADTADVVIGGIAFETDMLQRTKLIFAPWDTMAAALRVLAVRILAAQLHAISRDGPEITRHPALSRVFDGLTVSLPEVERMSAVWDILSSLPAGAAEAADPDIQRFVEYRGRKSRATTERRDDVDDLPGYVLAMISPTASGRIAGAIAREIELNRLHERKRDEKFDFAKALCQVMLRGPHESIFDHLLPRIHDRPDRDMVLLLRKHVARVRLEAETFDVEHLVGHINALLKEDLERTTSPMLRQLARGLQLYREVAAGDSHVWVRLKAGTLIDLFDTFDKLAANTCVLGPTGRPLEGHRKHLLPLYHQQLMDLQTEVVHYLDLPVGRFAERAQALNTAANTVGAIEKALHEHHGLQPPERTLLVALMQHLRSIFERTIRWYCDEPQRRKDAQDKVGFWILFACDPKKPLNVRFQALQDVVRGDDEAAERRRLQELRIAEQTQRLRLSAGQAPPSFIGQRERFEEFFVGWMSSDLDVESDRKSTRLNSSHEW